MGAFIDMTGYRNGKVTVIKRIGHTKNNQILWECKCDCGKTIYETRSNLVYRNVKSCGCETRKRAATMNYKHGASLKASGFTDCGEAGGHLGTSPPAPANCMKRRPRCSGKLRQNTRLKRSGDGKRGFE